MYRKYFECKRNRCQILSYFSIFSSFLSCFFFFLTMICKVSKPNSADLSTKDFLPFCPSYYKFPIKQVLIKKACIVIQPFWQKSPKYHLVSISSLLGQHIIVIVICCAFIGVETKSVSQAGLSLKKSAIFAKWLNLGTFKA